MTRLLALLAVLVAVVSPLHASNAVSLGYSDSIMIVGPDRECSGGTLIHNHDGSFENGYTWQYAGCHPPYYGAFGEGYDLGLGLVACGAFWLTTLPGWPWCTGDCYVWAGGVGSLPGAVIGVVTGVVFTSVPTWPSVGQYDIGMNFPVSGPFTVGYWGDWPDSGANFFCGADENGPRGHPWTCIAPGIGYPSGWQDPAVVWPDAKSLGCGVYFEQGTPAEGETWGTVKALFR